MSDKFPPSIEAARLYERISAKGNVYLAGRLGGLKLVALKTNDLDQDGHPIWQLKVSAAANRKDQSLSPRASSSGGSQPSGFGAHESQADDQIPF